MRQIVQKFHFETIFPSSLIVFQLVQVNVNADVEFVKYFTVANFPIVLILPKKSTLIWTFLAKKIENGGCFTHLFEQIDIFCENL